MNKASGNPREAAEALAIQALNFLATEPERLGRFLALSGLGPESIRAAAAESGFLANVLAHLGEDAGQEARLGCSGTDRLGAEPGEREKAPEQIGRAHV